MSWLKRKLRNWLSEDDTAECVSIGKIRVSEDCVESDPVLNFKVYNAVGGKIVEFRHYDRQKDRNFNQTYIITNDQDFGDRIAKIATMEILKQ